MKLSNAKETLHTSIVQELDKIPVYLNSIDNPEKKLNLMIYSDLITVAVIGYQMV